jgi:hypothetical protein
MRMRLLHLVLCFKKKRKLIYCNVMCLIQAQLLQFIQPTSLLICKLSLGHLPSLYGCTFQNKLNTAPCIPSPTSISWWNFPHELLWDPKQLTQEKGENKKKHVSFQQPMIMALEIFISKRLCSTRF